MRNVLCSRNYRLAVYLCLMIGIVGTMSVAHAINEDYNRIARVGTPTVDGNLNDRDWEGADWQEMDVYSGGNQPKGFAAKSAILWDDEFFYVGIEVDDETHAVPKAVVDNAGNLWKGDSPQHRVDLEYDSLTGDAQDIEWGYALQDAKVLVNAWASAGNIEFTQVEIVRDDATKKTYYEAALILTVHKPKGQTLSKYVSDNPEALIGYSDMVNANDGGDRLGWLEWSSGTGASKDANQFGTLSFDLEPQAVNPTGKLASVWATMKQRR